MAGFGEELTVIAESARPQADGMVRVPSEVIDDTAIRICNMGPNEVFWASGNSVLYDRGTQGLMVDARDFVTGLPTSETHVLENPALMRVMATVGGAAVDGWLVDYRRIRFPRYRDSKLELGTDTDTFQNLHQNYGTVLPLAAVFNRAGNVKYEGPEELEGTMHGLMLAVDRYLATQWAAMPKFNYRLQVADEDIIRPPKPSPVKTNTELAIREKSNLPVLWRGDVVAQMAVSSIFGIINSFFPKPKQG